MPTGHFFRISQCFASLLLMLLCGVCFAQAQTPTSSPVLIAPPPASHPNENGVGPAAHHSEYFCGGFIEAAPAPNALEVVGGEQEQEKRTYSAGDYVFISGGAQQGIKVGQEFMAVRPRGQFTTKLTQKKGSLGVFTQEIGTLRVTDVKAESSVAIVTDSCEMMLHGDLLRPVPQRVSPNTELGFSFDHFSDPNGKQKGRIVLARGGREMVSRDQIVYIDLGTEDNIKAGDRLSVYRKAGTGNVTRFRDEEVTPASSYGFESERFRGGRFSNKAQRVKDPTKTSQKGPSITTPEVFKHRPPVPRKVVGEIVILNAQGRTATAVVTRVAQEIHTGDFVELQ